MTETSAQAGPVERADESWWRVAWPITLAVCSIAVVVPAFATPFLPTHDGPQHLLHAWMLNHLGDAAAGYETFYERAQPITCHGFNWLQAPLERWFGWQRAQQLTLASMTLGWSWCWFALVRVVSPRDRALALFGFATAWQWVVYMGFFPFFASTVVGAGTLALAARSSRGLSHDLLLCGALFIAAMMHSVATAWCGVGVWLLRVGGAPHGERFGAALRTAILGVPALLVAAAGSEYAGEALQSMDTGNSLYWEPLAVALGNLGAVWVAGPGWRYGVPLALAGAGAILALARPRGGRGVALGVFALAGLVAAMVLPFHSTSWEYAAPRVLPLSGLAGVAALAVVSPGRRRIALALALAFVIASNAWAAGYHSRLGRAAAPWLTVASADVTRQGWLLPLVFEPYGPFGWTNFEPPVRYAKPFINLGNLLVLEQGGASPYLFATSPTTQAHVLRSDRPSLTRLPDRNFWEEVHRSLDAPRAVDAWIAQLAADGREYEHVAVWSAEHWPAFEARGYDAVAGDDGLTLARFTGCAMHVDVGEVTQGGTATLTWAPFPLIEARGSATVTVPSDGIARFDRLTCGHVWFQLAVDVDGRRLACMGTEHPGQAVVPLERDEAPAPLPCRLVEPAP